MLEATGLTKNFGGFSLKSINFTLTADDYFVLVGPSGSGKSQLLELLAGLQFADEGRILLNNIDITRLPTQDRGIAMVFQDYAVFPHLTVRQNIAYSLKNKGLSTEAGSGLIEKLAHETGIHHLLNRSIKGLSGGEVQRVVLARTLASNPKVLLLDEPLSNVDARVKHDLRRLLRAIHRKGIPVIHVTHDFEDAIALANKVGVIKDGRIIQIGPPDQVLLHPASEFVAKFAGIRNFYRCIASLGPSQGIATAVVKEEYKLFFAGDGIGEGSVVIPANEIVVSLNKPDSSARNVFFGKITELFPTANGVEIFADCGLKLAALVSHASETELGLKEGLEVWFSFKVSSVRFIQG
jgi:molybdopterin-binding protein